MHKCAKFHIVSFQSPKMCFVTHNGQYHFNLCIFFRTSTDDSFAAIQYCALAFVHLTDAFIHNNLHGTLIFFLHIGCTTMTFNWHEFSVIIQLFETDGSSAPVVSWDSKLSTGSTLQNLSRCNVSYEYNSPTVIFFYLTDCFLHTV